VERTLLSAAFDFGFDFGSAFDLIHLMFRVLRQKCGLETAGDLENAGATVEERRFSSLA
jgi:hypothetical protein